MGVLPHSTLFLTFFSPLPQTFQLKKASMLGRGVGVRVETLSWSLWALFRQINWTKEEAFSMIVEMSELKSGLQPNQCTIMP